MFRALLIAAISAAAIGSVQASTIDLTDAVYSNQVYGGTSLPIKSFQEVVDGVTFTFDTSGGFRSIGAWEGGSYDPGPSYQLTFGGGGGSPTSFTMSASADVSLNSFLGFAQQYNTNPIFDVSGTGISSVGNTFSTVGWPSSSSPVVEAFVGGPLSLLANTLYTFTVTNPTAATVGYLTGFDFTSSSVSSVPGPAALPLLLTGIAGLGIFGMRRRRNAVEPTSPA